MFGNPKWWATTLGIIVAVLLAFELGYWLTLGPVGYKRRLITKRGRQALNKLEKILMRKGLLDLGYHTPSQITAVATGYRTYIPPPVEPLDIYLRAKYSCQPPSMAEYQFMRKGFRKLIHSAKGM
jgi:hypothetical protein